MTLDMRMLVWLETVPVLLQRLDVKHVAIVTHSAGTIYTLNTLLHHRSILDPKAPYVAFLGSCPTFRFSPKTTLTTPIAPFVSSAHSGAALPTVASKLPTNILNTYTNLNTFVASKIIPSASWSGGIISSATALFTSPTNTDLPSAETSTSSTLSSRYGCDEETAKLIEKLASKYLFAENTSGVNEELKLVLRKCEDADWGDATEYSSCVCKIADNEAEFSTREPNAAKVSVEGFFAGSDIMIAKRGQEYFEQCWQSDGVRDKIDFATLTCPEADHDSLLIDQRNGALKIVFERIVQLDKDRS